MKPYMVGTVLEACRGQLAENPARVLVVSIAAGVPLAALESFVPSATRVVRCMPNTPCLVGCAAVGFALGGACAKGAGDAEATTALFAGTVLEVKEADLDAVTAVSGSGPAYVFLFIEALADGGVRAGLSRQVALQLAAQTAGRANATGNVQIRAPKDQVCSPGGTTTAVVGLEKSHAAMSAVVAANAKCKEMGKKK